jgi:hypothetical protein
MDPRLRRYVIVGAIALFVLGFTAGFLVGSGDDEPLAAPSPTPSPSSTGTTTVVETPPPGQAPAIGTQGRVLLDGDRPVVAVPATAACQSLIEPGVLGECGEVSVGGQHVVWVVQQGTTASGTPALGVRIFSFVPDAGGWVEWLLAEDPTGERWSDVNVLTADLTGDGVSELLVGFRGVGGALRLDFDIVGYGQDAVPEVLAHPDAAGRGSVVISGGAILEYSARYPGGEPACCPPSFLLQTIVFEDGFFRVVGAETVVPTAVPPSQL